MKITSNQIGTFFTRPRPPLFKPSFLSKLPQPISWFLGYHKNPIKCPQWARLLSILLATMAGMLCNLALAERAPLYVKDYRFTTLVPSFAASCILIYGAVEAPFSQPRNMITGHLLAGIIGVGITKLFMTNAHNEKYLWLAGALSVSVTSVAMDYTGTVHPPSGASALLPSMDYEVRKLGWSYLAVLMVHSCVFLGVALLCNNVVRVYPKFWLWPDVPTPKSQVSVSAEGINSTGVLLSEDEIKVLEAIRIRC